MLHRNTLMFVDMQNATILRIRLYRRTKNK